MYLPEGGTGGSPAEEDSRPEGSLEGGSWSSVSERSNKRTAPNATTQQRDGHLSRIKHRTEERNSRLRRRRRTGVVLVGAHCDGRGK